jgi:hypothetical protein
MRSFKISLEPAERTRKRRVEYWYKYRHSLGIWNIVNDVTTAKFFCGLTLLPNTYSPPFTKKYPLCTIIRQVEWMCIRAAVGRNYVFSKLSEFISKALSYFRVADNRTALICVKNYSGELLQRLVPSPQVIQHGNALQTTITEEGLMQESYILGKNSLHYDEDNMKIDNHFASSLLVDDLSPIAMALARDILKLSGPAMC